MKKVVLSSMLLSSVLLLGSVVSHADATSAETDLNITIKPDKGSEETGGPYKGKLAIVHKPTTFDFQGTATKGQLILNNENPNSQQQYISVSDDRATDDAKLGKWILEGKLSAIDKLDENGNVIPRDASADQTTDLQGSLVINKSKVLDYAIGTNEVTVNGVTDIDPAAVDPAAAESTTTQFGNAGEDALTLPAGSPDATRIMTSNADTKNGAATNLGDNKFIIKAGSAVNDTENDFHYHGVVTWTVASQP